MPTKTLATIPSYSIDEIIKDGKLAINEEALKRKGALLTESLKIPAKITSVEERDAAIAASGRLKKEMDDAEDSRVAMKANFWKMCGAIDATAKEFIEEMKN